MSIDTDWVRPINYFRGCEWVSLPEGVHRRGLRHQANAERYMAAGNPAYALGSMRKALRAFRDAMIIRRWVLEDD